MGAAESKTKQVQDVSNETNTCWPRAESTRATTQYSGSAGTIV